MNCSRLALFLLIFASSLIASDAASDKLLIQFFGSSTCEECHEIQTLLLSPLAAQYKDRMDLKIHDLETDSGFRLATTMEKIYKVSKPSPQELFLPDTFFTGYADIMKKGKQYIEDRINNPALWKTKSLTLDTNKVSAKAAIEEKVSMFTFIGLFAAGFIDGINPCAIATMIFLISFLGTQNRKRRDILKIGLTFSATVFITYFLIGLGAFRVLTLMSQFYWLSLGIRIFGVGLAVWVAIWSIRDAIVYYRTRDTNAMKVQLPKPIKMLIHSVIKDNLSSNKIVVGAVITGFIVTLLEGACTAKIYLPTIVLMTKAVGFKLIGWLLLVFYNFLFVLPLLIVLTAAAYGLKWTKLSKFTQNHMALMKVLLAIVLLALAAFISVGK